MGYNPRVMNYLIVNACIQTTYIDSPSVARGLRYFSTQES